MPSELRFVFDTNVVVSALLLRHSVARLALERGSRQGKLLISRDTIEELNSVLQRKGFEKYISEEERMEFLVALANACTLVETSERVSACRDPRDDKFLELAVNGGATFIVTGVTTCSSCIPFAESPSSRHGNSWSTRSPTQAEDRADPTVRIARETVSSRRCSPAVPLPRSPEQSRLPAGGRYTPLGDSARTRRQVSS